VNISLSTFIAEAVNESWAAANSGETSIFSRLIQLRQAFVPGIPEWLFQLLIGTLLTTPILLVLCEATPKVIATRANLIIALIAAKPLTLLHRFMIPARIILSRILRIVDWLLGSRKQTTEAERRNEDHGKPRPKLREEDFLSMVEQGHAEGAIQTEELELIRKVFELDDRRVEDITTSLSQIKSLPAQMSVAEALGIMKHGTPYSRLPVFQPGNPAQIVGVLYSKDLLIARLDPSLAGESIQVMMRKPFVVSPNLKLGSLFRRFKQSQTHMAVVEGQDGAALGVVTMTDVLEALFEDFLDIDEEDGPPIARTQNAGGMKP
jgi:putative hemolysin